ncbi:hypothetical protein F5J12DRAFT_899307 [Pisolithus orientalis]|uniref:uncharacterized protein n=1 Tax=Pisolithus orientalis TaxID=936130 RepID=UPI00222417E9|nr:uncharacterized protein F5J12DRAFT_899307 [Pisolithus orientalis]KAI5984398.1 hypothetical protein F5J12DRAFT_899307 [Pisolithus orientalis]
MTRCFKKHGVSSRLSWVSGFWIFPQVKQGPLWRIDVLEAEANQGDSLDIYLLKGEKAPTIVEVQLKLMKNPPVSPGSHGSVAWLVEGISIEDAQDQLRSELRQSHMSTRQEVKVSEKRKRLSARIDKFHGTSQAFLKGLEVDGVFIPQDDPAFLGQDDEDLEATEEGEEPPAELMSIWMPSSIGATKLMELGLHDLLKEEMELRIGQANDCLDQLQTNLGHKAMLYRQNFHSAQSTREGTRTKQDIQTVVARINKQVRSYQRARQAILQLEPNQQIGQKYQAIQPQDLAVSKDVTEENQFGQGTSKMAWFWMMDGEQGQLNAEKGGLMEEFYRINWLKARARRDRWKEELSLVRHEMVWAILWFEFQKDMWEQRALQLLEPGKKAYAH